MGIARYFSGSRESGGKRSFASELMRKQIAKGGAIDHAEIHKKLIAQKMSEVRFKDASKAPVNFAILGRAAPPKERSKRSQDVLKELARREVLKDLKKARKAVEVAAQRFSNGKIDTKGRIYDTAGNMVARVNLKTGSMTSMFGQSFGRYVPKSYMTKLAIEGAIAKNSPFLINQRKMVEVQKQEQLRQEALANQQQANSHWNSPQYDIWGNPISDFLSGFF